MADLARVPVSSQQVGLYYAAAFNQWQATLYSCTTGTGSLTGLLNENGVISLRDGTTFFPFATTCPLIWDFGQSGAENVATAAVSGGGGWATTEPPSASITATCANGHGKGSIIKSGTYGLQEAVNYCHAMGGGIVIVDANWTAYGGVETTITTTATPYTDTTILDARGTTWQVYQKSGSNYAAVATTGSALSVTSLVTSTTAAIGTTLAVTGAVTLSSTIVGGKQPLIAVAATKTLTAGQSGSLVLMGATTGEVITLPAPAVGLEYDIVITVSNTSNYNEIKTDAGTTYLLGEVAHSATGIAALTFWADGSTIVALKMDGAHLGGLIGSHFHLKCISTTQWEISGTNLGTATMTTAFNASA